MVKPLVAADSVVSFSVVTSFGRVGFSVVGCCVECEAVVLPGVVRARVDTGSVVTSVS